MPDESSDVGEDPGSEGLEQDFLATLPAGAGEIRLAGAVAFVSAVFFVAFVPFARVPMGEMWAFIPLYESALAVSDLITAILLFGQYGFLRSPGLLVLACAYLFTMLLTVAHALSFPGMFPTGGQLGGGSQTTAWLYTFWHAGFPLLVMTYALCSPPQARSAAQLPDAEGRAATSRDIAFGIFAVVVVAALLVTLATSGHDLLPVLLYNRNYTASAYLAFGGAWSLSLIALVLLWRRKPRTVLDLWLMVVMCTWLADVALSAVLNARRFDLGFYSGRIYGLLAGSFVMMVLLIDNGRLYARLLRSHDSERRARRRELAQATELLAANQALDAFSYSVSHDLRAPLRAMDGYARMLEEDYSERLGEDGRRLLRVVRDGSRKMSSLIDTLLEFSRLGRAPLAARSLDLTELTRHVVEELRGDVGQREVEFVVGELGPVYGDLALLRQVLANLIGNAVKYSRNKPQARVEIGRMAGPTPQAPPIYFVRDNGAGFDMRYSAKLFNVFQRLHSDHEYEGTGVGLAIVQRVIVHHGGRVWAEARLGEGATFYFTLPGRPDEGALPSGTAVPAQSATPPEAAPR